MKVVGAHVNFDTRNCTDISMNVEVGININLSHLTLLSN